VLTSTRLSKALLNAYTLLLAREHPHLSINGCSPGFIETDMTRVFTQGNGKTPSEMGMKTPEAGATTPVMLALGEGLRGNGRWVLDLLGEWEWMDGWMDG